MVKYKKFFAPAIFAILIILIFSSCSSASEFTIYFDSNNGSEVAPIYTDTESRIIMPDNPAKSGYVFEGWYYDNETFLKEYKPNLTKEPLTTDTTLYAKWRKLVSVAVPVAIDNIIYNGSLQVGITASNLYMSSYGAAIDAGEYTAEVILSDIINYCWEDGTKEKKYIIWNIAKAEYDMDNAIWKSGVFLYDKRIKTVNVEGLPEGVTVANYTNNSKTEVGSYTASVTFDYDKENYNIPLLSNLDWSIGKGINTLDINSPDKFYDGTPYNCAEITVDENIGGGEVTYEYKLQAEEDISFSALAPNEKGAYTIKATSAATVNYHNISVYSSFIIGDTLTFDYQGATGVNTIFNKVIFKDYEYGVLPSPVKTEWEFEGWYDSAIDGNLITSSTIVNIENGHILYARWYTEGLEFKYLGENSLVSKGTATAAEVTIPATHYGRKVTGISDYGFQSYTQLSSLILNKNIAHIGNYAFRYCGNLTVIYIEGINRIYGGAEMFEECYSLKVYVPDAASATIYKAASYWSDYADLIYSKEIIDENGFAVENNVLLQYLADEQEVTIPSYIVSLGKYAFSGVSSEVKFAEGSAITAIGDYVFWNYKGANVTLPVSITSIGYYSFYSSINLIEIIIPESVISIGEYAFYNCTSLNKITLKRSSASGITSGGRYMLYFCSSSLAIYVPDVESANTYKTTVFWAEFSGRIYITPQGEE